ncbi:MAG: CDP-alcohol phosphatidyltransferase family protein [Phycisphaerales bacterium]|nr:CDP-alcohol phosphatidyltransferase family protein [Phycisphaerales bacterium]
MRHHPESPPKNGARIGRDDVVDQRRPLIGIAMLPSAATLGNLLCGFLAVMCCVLSTRAAYSEILATGVHKRIAMILPTDVAIGCYLVVAAMFFDVLDGRLARIARRTTEFGAQLDSIADVVSFGIAPIMLYLTLLMQLATPATGEPTVFPIQWRLALTAGMVFISCAAIRLARYNAENIQSESGTQRFSGLPTPAAAAVVIGLLALHEHLVLEGSVALGVNWPSVIRWALIPTAVGLGLLMVSRMDYVHVFNVYVRRDRPPTHLILAVAALAIGWMFSLSGLITLLAVAYVLSGIVLNIRRVRRISGDKPAALQLAKPEGGQTG